MDPANSIAAVHLQRYGQKGVQHLRRVALSHRLALAGLASSPGEWSQEDLGQSTADELSLKLRRGLNEIHLIALKAEFELLLNRLVTVLWTGHFAALTATALPDRRIKFRDVADAALASGDLKSFVVDTIVPRHGLGEFVALIQSATGLAIPGRTTVQFSDWCEIVVAFEVRHLVEHRDGKIDVEFVKRTRDSWSHSSWGADGRAPVPGHRLYVEDTDVDRTAASMIDAAAGLTAAMLDWDADAAR